MDTTTQEPEKNLDTRFDGSLAIISAAEAAKVAGAKKACELLPKGPAQGLLMDYIQQNVNHGLPEIKNILNAITGTVQEGKYRKKVASWPFQAFWANPREPKHSELLRFFIDPTEPHGCGVFMLRRFFDAVGLDLPVDKKSIVLAEVSKIDLLIEGQNEGDRYAVIIENKINEAEDQKKQLKRYVDKISKEDIDPKNIYVLYMPLTAEKHPTADSLGNIQECGVHYKHVTFENEIVKWLQDAGGTLLKEHDGAEAAKEMRAAMAKNISHYLDFISYLVSQKKGTPMDPKIIEQLKKADENGKLPKWSDINALPDSVAALVAGYQAMLRGKFLLAIKRELSDNLKTQSSFLDGDQEISVDSEFDTVFEKQIVLGICRDSIKGAIVGIGTMPENQAEGINVKEGVFVYTGYRKSGGKEEQEAFSKRNEIPLKNKGEGNCWWHASAYDTKATYKNCLESKTIERLAKELVEMCEAVEPKKALGMSSPKPPK